MGIESFFGGSYANGFKDKEGILYVQTPHITPVPKCLRLFGEREREHGITTPPSHETWQYFVHSCVLPQIDGIMCRIWHIKAHT